MSASIRDVAKLAEVSLGTVSNVLNNPDKVSPKTVERVQAAIDKLGFVRNESARQLRAGKSRSIGMIVLDVSNPFFTEVARAAEDRADQEGLSLMLANSDESETREITLLELFEQQRVHGILISPQNQDIDHIRRVRDRGTHVVLVDSSSIDKGFSSVSVDDVAGGKMAVQHLLDCGKTKIAYVASRFDFPQVADRLKGAQQAALNAGKQITIFEAGNLNVIAGRNIGAQIIALPKSERPDGIFAANDLLAIGIMQAIIVDGSLRIPNDIALIGYDDIEFAGAAIVPLTSISQSAEIIGTTAVELLMEQGDSNATKQVVIEPQLIVRASTTR
ncbi:MAG: hypothetical protein RL319_345 [Actinomycetota bacterium]